MATTDLKVHITRQHDQVTVGLAGEAHLDFGASDEYIRKVMAHKPKLVIVDASELTFISSVGMSFLMHLQRAVQEAGGAMKLRSLQPQVELGERLAEALRH